jgi:Tfp pilus assembly protein PilN
MLKINLLPGYIVERRRVKALAILLGCVLVVEVVGFAAYLWAPVPGSLATKYAGVVKERDEARAEQAKVEKLEADTAALQARYAVKQTRVKWVEEADKRPAQFAAYFKNITRYFPADVVVNGLSMPSGGRLNLTGSTDSLMSAVRWYLNMLRCEMVAPNTNAVTFTPGQFAVGSANPRMAMPVSISLQLRPEELDFMRALAPPAGMGGGPGRGRGRMGAARGGGRGGGRGGMVGRAAVGRAGGTPRGAAGGARPVTATAAGGGTTAGASPRIGGLGGRSEQEALAGTE